MTRIEFERGYAERSGITVKHGYELGLFPAVPCTCGDESCEGWRRRYSDDGPASAAPHSPEGEQGPKAGVCEDGGHGL